MVRSSQRNSYRGDEGAIEESAGEGLPSIASATVGETWTGETMPGVAFVEALQRGGPGTILLVEDEGFVGKVSAEVLESTGYKLVIAQSGVEAAPPFRRASLAHKTGQSPLPLRNQNPRKWALITVRFWLEKAQLRAKPHGTKLSVPKNGAEF
jgi:hypothetical protein